MKVIAYLRVSTAEQARHYGLGVQEQAIRGWAKAGGQRIVATYRDEGESGGNGLDSRRGLAEALASMTAGDAEALVVASLDRLARDLMLQETVIARLEQAGTRVVSVAEPDVDSDEHTRVLIRQILGALAQYERAVIRGRMTAGKQAKRQAGGYIGGMHPFGTRPVDRQLQADDSEAETVAVIKRLRADGLSYRAIADELDKGGHRTRKGRPWLPMTVRRIEQRASGSL